jgi:anti-sigma regulatory factor (Ser/Thr protein kinase)
MDVYSSSASSEPFRFPHSCTLFLPSAAIAPKICRDFVGGVLHLIGFGHLTDRAALCTSELVTNVHRYADGLVHLQLSAQLTRVRVSVYDTSPALPTLRQPGVDDQCGRGLGLVEALSDGWGVTDSRLGLPIKGVWFELDPASRTA